jgi:hypothetical protein
MKPLKLTFRTVMIAALMLIAFAIAFDGLRKHTKVTTERSDSNRTTQVEPDTTLASETPATASI